MTEAQADPALVEAWLTARSVARGLPLPVHDRGGLRVDSGEPEERRRYLFVAPAAGLRELAETIDEPFVPLKLCRPGAELIALLPLWWRLAHDHFMLVGDASPAPARLPDGYRIALVGDGPVTTARIRHETGDIVASGCAVEQGGVFIFDRIRVEDAHQRRGLGTALMHALGAVRRDPGSRMVLTATDAGRALYHKLGWRDYCPYSTAVMPAADH